MHRIIDTEAARKQEDQHEAHVGGRCTIDAKIIFTISSTEPVNMPSLDEIA
jgi:hypothetical protein